MNRQAVVDTLASIYGYREAEIMVRNLFLDLFNGKSQHLNQEEHAILDDAIKRLLQHEPIQYITGKAYFRDLVLQVAPGVLIPRPETEELVDYVIKYAQNRNIRHILDIGTGSGCIALSLKKTLPDVKITAIDKSNEALAIAAQNADALGLEIELIQCDFLNPANRAALLKVDLIVSNPPYIGREEEHTLPYNVIKYEPAMALFADKDPLIFYKAIADFAAPAHTPVFCEINERWGAETKACFVNVGFEYTTIYKDLQGKERFISADL